MINSGCYATHSNRLHSIGGMTIINNRCCGNAMATKKYCDLTNYGLTKKGKRRLYLKLKNTGSISDNSRSIKNLGLEKKLFTKLS